MLRALFARSPIRSVPRRSRCRAGPTTAVGLSPRIAQRPPEQELHLPVDAAQVVGRPALDGVERVRVQPEQERLALSHGACPRTQTTAPGPLPSPARPAYA